MPAAPATSAPSVFYTPGMVQLTTALAPRRSISFKLKAYLALDQAPDHRVAAGDDAADDGGSREGIPRWWLIVATLVGGALSAAGANAANMFVDRDIDAVMHRTRDRPLVTGAVTPTAAFVFSIVLEVVAFVLFWRAVNLFSGLLALGAALFYVFVYSIGLKRRSTPEHRHRRRGRGVPCLDRLDRSHRPSGVARHRAVRDDRHLDAVAFLGPGRTVPGRLQGGERPDAAGRRPLRPRVTPDHLVLAGPRRDVAPLRRRGPLRVDLLGRSGGSPVLSTWPMPFACGVRTGPRKVPCACSRTRSPI